MKLFLLNILIASLAFAANETGFRVAYVDLQRALQSVDAGKKAKSDLEKEVKAKRDELEKLQANIQKEFEALEKKAGIMNESAKAQKQAELQKRVAELQKNAFESQNELGKRERELTKPLLEELRSIIEGVGKEKGFQLILEKNEGAVLYAETGSDLTEQVIERFNARRKGKK